MLGFVLVNNLVSILCHPFVKFGFYFLTFLPVPKIVNPFTGHDVQFTLIYGKFSGKGVKAVLICAKVLRYSAVLILNLFQL